MVIVEQIAWAQIQLGKLYKILIKCVNNVKFVCRYQSSNNAQITQSNGNNERV